MKLFFLLVSFFAVVATHSQERVVEGRVLDLKNQPLAGVNITQKGTANGTVTDNNGRFSLKVNSKDAKLVISFVGAISQEISIDNNSSLEIVLGQKNNDLKYWCCTDHPAPDGPHCDTDKDILRRKFKCKNFERQ